MSNRAVEPPPAAREFDEQSDDDLEEEETGAGENDDDDDDGDLWDSPDEDADEDEEEGEGGAEGSGAEIASPAADEGVSGGGAPPAVATEQPVSPPEPSPVIDFATDLPGTPTVVDRVVDLFVDDIAPDPDQPRLDVDEDLADSIDAEGVKQPIVVRVHPNAHGFAIISGGKDTGKATTQVGYIIVDGERRWRASVKAGRKTIPARVTTQAEDAGDRLLLQVTLNEGKRLAPMEEANAWARIMAAKGWNIQQLAAALGRAKSTVSDRLAILDAPKVFQDLFAKGQLSAAAAPIVREYRDVPERILKEVVKDLLGDEYDGWGQFVEHGVAVPVGVVKECLENTLIPSWGSDWLAPIDTKLAAEYTGAVATVKGKKYAVDVEAYRALQQTHQAAASSSGKSGSTSYQETAADRRYREQAAKRQRDANAKAKKERALRKAQFDAISAKLPDTIGGFTNAADALSRFLVASIVGEMTNDGQREAIKALDLTPPKRRKFGGFAFDKAILAHSEQLRTAGERMKLALQLCMAPGLHPNAFGEQAKRITAAAQATRIDLKKITTPDPDKAEKKPPAKAKAKSAKKGGRR